MLRDRGLGGLKPASEIARTLRLAPREHMDHRSASSVRERAKSPIERRRILHSRLTICLTKPECKHALGLATNTLLRNVIGRITQAIAAFEETRSRVYRING